MPSYGTIAGWRAYATERGNQAPTLVADPLATAALTRASDYIRTRYVLRMRAGTTGTEPEVVEATYIAASLDLAAPGFWSKTYTASQVKVLTRVDSISWTPVAQSGGMFADDMLPTSPAIEALLMPYSLWGLPSVMVV